MLAWEKQHLYYSGYINIFHLSFHRIGLLSNFTSLFFLSFSWNPKGFYWFSCNFCLWYVLRFILSLAYYWSCAMHVSIWLPSRVLHSPVSITQTSVVLLHWNLLGIFFSVIALQELYLNESPRSDALFLIYSLTLSSTSSSTNQRKDMKN